MKKIVSFNRCEIIILLPGQIVELSQRSNILVSSVMEETGGLGVDVVIDNGGM